MGPHSAGALQFVCITRAQRGAARHAQRSAQSAARRQRQIFCPQRVRYRIRPPAHQLCVETHVGAVAGRTRPGAAYYLSHCVLGGPQTQNSPVYIASNTFNGDLQNDLMNVTVAFSLSKNSQAGLSGFVQQTAVPVAAALWLLDSSMLELIGVARRRLTAA